MPKKREVVRKVKEHQPLDEELATILMRVLSANKYRNRWTVLIWSSGFCLLGVSLLNLLPLNKFACRGIKNCWTCHQFSISVFNKKTPYSHFLEQSDPEDLKTYFKQVLFKLQLKIWESRKPVKDHQQPKINDDSWRAL